MPYHESYETLLYQYEVLNTRLKIREHYLKTVVKEVYENIGQMLSLIRIKLLGMQQDFGTGTKESINSSGEMVGKTIHDLRSMCRLFYPEEEITKGSGLFSVLEEEIKAWFPNAIFNISKDASTISGPGGDKGLLLFGILLELLDSFKEHPAGDLISVNIQSANGKLTILFTCSGETKGPVKARSTEVGPGLTVFGRAALLAGDLSIKKTAHHNRTIKLVVPIK